MREEYLKARGEDALANIWKARMAEWHHPTAPRDMPSFGFRREHTGMYLGEWAFKQGMMFRLFGCLELKQGDMIFNHRTGENGIVHGKIPPPNCDDLTAKALNDFNLDIKFEIRIEGGDRYNVLSGGVIKEWSVGDVELISRPEWLDPSLEESTDV